MEAFSAFSTRHLQLIHWGVTPSQAEKYLQFVHSRSTFLALNLQSQKQTTERPLGSATSLPKRMQNRDSNRCVHTQVHDRATHHSQEVEASVHHRMDGSAKCIQFMQWSTVQL